MAPNWISTAKVLPKSSSSKPKKRCTSRRWPVEDTGRNSVRPSTTPRKNALRRSNDMTNSVGTDQGRDARLIVKRLIVKRLIVKRLIDKRRGKNKAENQAGE